MCRWRSPEALARRDENRKARQQQEATEHARLQKKLDDYVKKHVAAGTATGRGYKTEVKKLQDAADDYYAGTELGRAAARLQQKRKDAAAETVELLTEIQELRDAPGHRSCEKKRELEDLEEQLAKKRKVARGVKPADEARAAKRRSDARSAVAKLRRDLQQARRGAGAAQARRVEELEKELKKAEQKVARFEASDRRKEFLDGLRSRLQAIVARATPGTALARDVETLSKALTAFNKLKRLDTSAEEEALTAAVVKLEEAQRGGADVREAVKNAVEAVEPWKEHDGRKRRRSQKADQRVDDAEAALVAAKRRRSDGQACADDEEEAKKALVTATRLQDVVDACGERAALRKESNERLKAIRETKGGDPDLANAIQDATEALNVFGRQKRPVSEKETDALDEMMDALNGRGAGIVNRRTEAIAAFVEASALRKCKVDRREAAARELEDLKAQVAALPDRDDVDHDEEARAKLEGGLARVEARVALLERTDKITKVADELSRGLRELETSGTGDAAYKKSIDDAKTVVATFRGRPRCFSDFSEVESKLRHMLQALRDSPGRGQAARTARDAAVTKVREALMTKDEIATASVGLLKELGEGAPAVCTYEKTKDALAEGAKDALVGPLLDDVHQVSAFVRAAIAEARKDVDALRRLRDTLSRRDHKKVGGLVDKAIEAIESLENSRNILARLEVAEGALSRLDGKFDALRGLRNEAAAFGRLKAVASSACTALGIATAFRGHAATKYKARYDREIEEASRLRDELEAFEKTGGSGPAYDKELEKKRAAWKAAYAKTPEGRRVAKWEARVLGAAGTNQVLTRDIISDARVLTDKGHVVCAQMKQKRKKIYVGVTKEGNVDKEARDVIRRDNFPIKNDRGRPIKFKQCEVVSLGEVDSRVTALLIERTLQHEWANDEDNTPVDYAYQTCGGGSLTHTVGRSEAYVIGIELAEGDQQSPSRFPLGRALEFTAAFEAQIAAAMVPPDSMPDERARGDLDEHMIKGSKQRAVYHAYTRGAWSVHWWKKSPRSPYEYEQRWLWPSAEAARAWTQKKIDQKTSERGGYAIEDEDE